MMIRTNIRLAVILLVSITVSIASCSGTVRYSKTDNPDVEVKQTGPPPHAPAHGYRHKHHDGVELVYKSDIGVYVVVGYADHYYHKDKYYRVNNSSWEVSVHINGKWKQVSQKKLPKGLRGKQICKKGA